MACVCQKFRNDSSILSIQFLSSCILIFFMGYIYRFISSMAICAILMILAYVDLISLINTVLILCHISIDLSIYKDSLVLYQRHPDDTLPRRRANVPRNNPDIPNNQNTAAVAINNPNAPANGYNTGPNPLGP